MPCSFKGWAPGSSSSGLISPLSFHTHTILLDEKKYDAPLARYQGPTVSPSMPLSPLWLLCSCRAGAEQAARLGSVPLSVHHHWAPRLLCPFKRKWTPRSELTYWPGGTIPSQCSSHHSSGSHRLHHCCPHWTAAQSPGVLPSGGWMVLVNQVRPPVPRALPSVTTIPGTWLLFSLGLSSRGPAAFLGHPGCSSAHVPGQVWLGLVLPAASVPSWGNQLPREGRAGPFQWVE